MRRRDLIVGVWAIATVGSAQAQEGRKVHRIAVVSASRPAAQLLTSDSPMGSELHRLGYIEGRNLLIERYSAEGRAAHNPELAREVVRRNPDVIVAFTNNPVLDFKAATSTIPILAVFVLPVETGIVRSLARPGGNITGVSIDVGLEQQWAKRIQLLRQVVPQAMRLGFLVSRSDLGQYGAAIQEFYRIAGASLVGPPLDNPIDEAEYRRVFAATAQDGADAIMAFDSSENWVNRKIITALAEKHRFPAIYPFREFVDAGGLMSYGMSTADAQRRMAGMVAQILKGVRPADIPVYQPTKIELVVNLKAAAALGLTIPPELRAVADEEIE
jgi:putative ABC transport system substrate-binding protein